MMLEKDSHENMVMRFTLRKHAGFSGCKEVTTATYLGSHISNITHAFPCLSDWECFNVVVANTKLF